VNRVMIQIEAVTNSQIVQVRWKCQEIVLLVVNTYSKAGLVKTQRTFCTFESAQFSTLDIHFDEINPAYFRLGHKIVDGNRRDLARTPTT
jgi:hypothetical protein